MIKLKKYVFKAIATLMLISASPISNPISIIASDVSHNYDNVIEVDLREQADLQHQQQLDELLAELQQEHMDRNGSWAGTIRVEEGRTQVKNTNFIRADNQPSGGTIFRTPGSSISWNGGGGARINVNLEYAWGPVNVSFNNGRAGVTGFNAAVPNNLINTPVALYIQHQIEGKELLVYERQNVNSPWVHTRTNTSTAVTRQVADIRRVW